MPEAQSDVPEAQSEVPEHGANSEFTHGKNIKSLLMQPKWFQTVTMVILKLNKVIEAYSLTTLGVPAIRSCQNCSNMQIRLRQKVKIEIMQNIELKCF